VGDKRVKRAECRAEYSQEKERGTLGGKLYPRKAGEKGQTAGKKAEVGTGQHRQLTKEWRATAGRPVRSNPRGKGTEV